MKSVISSSLIGTQLEKLEVNPDRPQCFETFGLERGQGNAQVSDPKAPLIQIISP